MTIATQEQLPDLVPQQKTITVNGLVHLYDEVTKAASPGGFVLQVPTGAASVWYGDSTVTTSASDATRGYEIVAGASFVLGKQSLKSSYVKSASSTRLTVIAEVPRDLG